MSININEVKWDDDAPDPAAVKWDDEVVAPKVGNGPEAPASGAAIPQLPEGYHTTGQNIGRAGRVLINAAASPGILANKLAHKVGIGEGTLAEDLNARLTDLGFPKSEGWGAVGEELAQSAPALAIPGGFIPQVLGNAAISAVQAPKGEELTQGAIGGALGAGGSLLTRGLPATKEARALMEQGIQPSVGQSVGGMANTIEQKASSIPLVGDAVTWARTRPMKEFQEKAIERVTGGAAKTLDEANTHATSLYDRVVPHLRPTTQAVTNVQQALRDAAQNPEMSQEAVKMLNGLAQKHFANFGQLDGPALKRLDSELGHLARKYQGGDPASKTLAGELYNVQNALRTGLEPGLPPELQGALRQANAVWRDLIPLNKAASSRADERITPRALQKALAKQQRTDVTRMKPDGLVDNAVAVLPSTVPDSGTAGRVLLGGAGIASGLTPEMLTAGASAGLGATRPVQRAIMGNTSWQRALQDIPLGAVLNALRSKRDEPK